MTDEKNDRLSRLAVYDVDEWRRQRTQKRAHAILARDRRLAGLNRAYSRFLEPVLVTGLSLMIVLWTVERALYLFS